MNGDEESFATAKPRRRWLRHVGYGLLIPLILALALLSIVACSMLVQHHSVQPRLKEALEELDRGDPGWRLADIEAARQQIPEEENSAPVVTAAAKLLPRKWPAPEFQERFAHLSPEKQLAPDDFARLMQELNNVQPALNEARKLAKMPCGRHPITYKRNILDTLLPHVDYYHQVMPLLLDDALQYDQRRDMKGALISCQAALNVARSLGDEPLATTQLGRIKGVCQACQGMERVLAQGEPTAVDLVALQKLLADEDAFPGLLIATRGMRAFCHEWFDALESGDITFSGRYYQCLDWGERLSEFVSRDNLRGQHPRMLALMSRWIALAQLPMPKQAEEERLFGQEVRELHGEDKVAELLLAAMPKIGDSSRREHALIDCTIAAFAAERYRQRHKKWPDSLDKLCPQFLEKVPLDPFDGEPLRYRRVEDGVIIYSISTDDTDNGGNLDREHPDRPGADIGIRLWDLAKRHQPPRPKPHEEE